MIVFAVAAVVAVAVAVAIAVALAVAVAIIRRTHFCKCATEFVALRLACFAPFAHHHCAYKITTTTILNAKSTTCINGFGFICSSNSSRVL